MGKILRTILGSALILLGGLAAQAATNRYIEGRRTTLQSGSTFYVSSGTVNTLNVGTATVTDNLNVIKITETGSDISNAEVLFSSDSIISGDAGLTYNASRDLLTVGEISVTTVTASKIDITTATVSSFTATNVTLNSVDEMTAASGSSFTFTGGLMQADVPMNSFSLTGLAAAAAAGESVRFEQLKILQVVLSSTTTQATTTSSTFGNTNLSASITPSNTANSVLIFVSGSLQADNDGTNAYLTVARNSTNLGDTDGFSALHPPSAANIRTGAAIICLDSPSSTSSITYNVQLRSSDNTNTVAFPATTGSTAVIILMEINGL